MSRWLAILPEMLCIRIGIGLRFHLPLCSDFVLVIATVKRMHLKWFINGFRTFLGWLFLLDP